jgi:MFS family permease
LAKIEWPTLNEPCRFLKLTSTGNSGLESRTFAGHLPDRLGGARVAAIFVIVQAAGLLLMSLAKAALLAAAGAALAGFGYSLVYPGLGVEAVSGVR